LRNFRETFVVVEKQYVLRIASVFMQQAKRMRPVILQPVACLAVLYLSTLSHKRQGFRKKKNTEKQIRILFFFTTFV